MIEGLRVYPAYQDARNGGQVVGAKGCEECKRTVSIEQRQDMGCGYAPSIEQPRSVWAPAAWRDDHRADWLTVCPGYSTSLPGVGEIVDAYPQWEQHTLTDYLDGQSPGPIALRYLTALRAGINDHQADTMRAASKRSA